MAQITDGHTYTSKYTYNFSGALIEEEYPSGRKVKNEFESDGDISRIYEKLTRNASDKDMLPSGKTASIRENRGNSRKLRNL